MQRRDVISGTWKEVDVSLLELQSPLNQVFAASHRGILVLNSEGRAVFVNPRGERLLGIGPDSHTPSTLRESLWSDVTVDSFPGVKDLPFREIIDSRRPVTDTRLSVTGGGGTPMALSASGFPVFGETGHVDKVVFFIDDISDNKAHEEGFPEREATFRTVFENAPIGIVHFDSHGIITACNESNAQIFGAGKDKIVGLNLAEDLTDLRMKGAYETCRSGKIGRFEGEYVSVAGNKPIVARASFVPFLSHTGSFSGGVELVEDITERRRTEEMLDWELKVNTAIAEIAGSLIAPSVPVGKIAEIVLEHAKIITGSGYGCISSVDWETGEISGHVAECAVAEQTSRGARGRIVVRKGPDGRYEGPWAEALNKRKAFYVNGAGKNQSPTGHLSGPPFSARLLFVPAMDGNELVGHISVAEPHRDYSQKDLEAVERLAHLYTLSLQRKNIERKVERLASYPELNPYPIIEVDFSRKVTYRNPAVVETLNRMDCPTNPEIFFPSDIDEILSGCQGEGSQHFYREVSIGAFTFGEDIFRPFGFNVIRIYARDVTEKRRSEEALQAAHDVLETKVRGRTKELVAANEALDDARALLEKVVVAVDQVEEGVAITDWRGLIEYVNPGFERLTGRQGKILSVRGSSRRLTESMRAAMEEALSEGKVWSGRLSRSRSGDARYEVEVSFSPVKDSSGRIINYVDVERDITRQAKIEAELHQTEKLEAISTLAGGIAHDFNNIVAGIIGFTEIMIEDTPEESPMHRRLSLVLKGAHRGKDLVDQILSFSRKRRTGTKPVSLARAIEETTEALRPRLPAAVELHRNIVAGENLILGDHVQIHQMLANLYANAIYAMRDQGGILGISLHRADHEEIPGSFSEEMRNKPWIRLTVSDTGCGMEKSTAERIFEPFFTTRGPGEGSGMGLSVVHGIVRRHDGVINVESEPGKGSTFHLFFPEYEGGVETSTDSGRISGGTEHILVVDDEVLITEMSKQRLERLGYTVATAASAGEALEVLGSAPGSV